MLNTSDYKIIKSHGTKNSVRRSISSCRSKHVALVPAQSHYQPRRSQPAARDSADLTQDHASVEKKIASTFLKLKLPSSTAPPKYDYLIPKPGSVRLLNQLHHPNRCDAMTVPGFSAPQSRARARRRLICRIMRVKHNYYL